MEKLIIYRDNQLFNPRTKDKKPLPSSVVDNQSKSNRGVRNWQLQARGAVLTQSPKGREAAVRLLAALAGSDEGGNDLAAAIGTILTESSNTSENGIVNLSTDPPLAAALKHKNRPQGY